MHVAWQFNSGASSEPDLTVPLEVVRDLISQIFITHDMTGSECFDIYTAVNPLKPLFHIRAHRPFKTSPFGGPMLLLSVVDHHLSDKLVAKGHLNAKQAEENFRRIFGDFGCQKTKGKKLFSLACQTDEGAKLLRYVLRLNSTKMVPTAWQEKNLPLGKYSPYLATFLSPLYPDKNYIYSMSDDECAKEVSKLRISDPDALKKLLCMGCNMRLAGQLKRCSKCKMAYYCNVECQRNDWKTHKVTCLSSV